MVVGVLWKSDEAKEEGEEGETMKSSIGFLFGMNMEGFEAIFLE